MKTPELKGQEIEDDERQAWLKFSEQALMQVWSDPEEDVYNELLGDLKAGK